VGLRAGLKVLEKRKSLAPVGIRISAYPKHCLVPKAKKVTRLPN
jgi:hypothetical protein